MRILYIITGLHLGGAEQSLFKFLKHLDRTKYEPLVIALEKGELQTSIETLGIIVHNTKNPYHVYKIIKQQKPHIIHSFMFHSNILARMLPRGKAKLVCSIRIVENDKWWHNAIDTFTEYRVDKYMANSQTVKNHMIHYGIPSEKIVVITNGIDFYDIAQTKPIILPEHSVVTIANMRSDKDYPTLFKAWQQLPPNITLYCIGDGDKRQEYENLAKNLPNVKILGYKPDAQRYLAGAEIFILSTHQEGMSNALLEAMAHNKPIIATDIPENKELIQDQIQGLLVKHGDANQLRNAVLKYIQNPLYAKQCADMARDKCAMEYDIVQKTKQLTTMYEAIP